MYKKQFYINYLFWNNIKLTRACGRAISKLDSGAISIRTEKLTIKFQQMALDYNIFIMKATFFMSGVLNTN